MAIEKALALIALKRTEQIGDISDSVEAAQAAQTAAETAQGHAEDAAEEAIAAVANKANIDGYYSDMTVGNAEQLISNDYVTDQTPYVFRTAGGNVDIGNREYDTLIGGTVVWNQLARVDLALDTYTTSNITFTKNSDGSFTVNGNTNGESSAVFFFMARNNSSVGNVQFTATHKYLLSGAPAGSGSSTYYLASLSFIDFGPGKIFTVANTTTMGQCYIRIAPNVTVSNLVFRPRIIDLTMMFGSTIADYLYSLEQATAGAGVAWFRRLFPKDYYAYDSGRLQSVQAASHDMVGFNQWDEQWENGYFNRSTGEKAGNTDTTYFRSKNYIPCFPSTQYYFKTPTAHASNTTYFAVLYYDAEKNYIGNITDVAVNPLRTTQANAYYMMFYCEVGTSGATYHNDLCINLSWSGYRNGEYEPYVKHSYPLDSTLTLRGIPKLDASNNLIYDGDTYEADGTVTRRYGIVDVGSLTGWSTNINLSGVDRFTLEIADAKFVANTAVANALCENFVVKSLADANANYKNGVFACDGKRFYFFTTAGSYVDSAAFKDAMSGVYLVYELATPTTETADAFQSPQIVNDFGTEQYVDAGVAAGTRDVAIPVGHDTRYIANLVDKLRRLPDSPDTAGDYLVHYNAETRRASYAAYTDGGRITALESMLPAPPAADGTYKLTATVADGEVTYSWEAQS